jgi:uncharacterized membrane protein YeiH
MITPLPTPALPPLLDLTGIAIFALSGALVAVRMRQTFVTTCFFALVTGVGGGTVRDVLIGLQAFWISDPWVPAAILASALLVWLTPARWWDGMLLEWADALGLAVYCVIGTAKAIAYGVAPLPAAVLGIVTGCVGGIIRDVLAGEPSILMRPELYVTAAALSAGLCALFTALDVPSVWGWSIAAGAGFALRGAAMVWRIELPAYRAE